MKQKGIYPRSPQKSVRGDSLHSGDLSTGLLQLGKSPAVIVVDLSNGFISSKSPLGGNFDKQVVANLELIEVATKHNVPIFFTTVVYDDESQASVFRQRLPALNILQRGSPMVDIHEKLRPYLLAERLIEKHFASAFFATDLAQKLAQLNVDSLLITGLTTSGCVRATCVDALQHNYSSVIVEEACGDRNKQAHEMSLHDMHAKYAQVMPLKQCVDYLSNLPITSI
jgi:nicotinamidase-related amidase